MRSPCIVNEEEIQMNFRFLHLTEITSHTDTHTQTHTQTHTHTDTHTHTNTHAHKNPKKDVSISPGTIERVTESGGRKQGYGNYHETNEIMRL